MREAQGIWDIWLQGGPFIGDNKSNAVVTVEEDWELTKSSKVVGTSKKGPFRWWQRDDNSQVETILPNVKMISIDRSVETDAATCSLKIGNITMDEHPYDDRVGAAGYYTWNYGESEESQARWGQNVNSWYNILAPNALIRTYEGYGGHDLSLDDAIEAGNLVLTGVWLADSIRVGADGTMGIECRDMSKLLIDQLIYPPLVPDGVEYPLKYCRWVYKEFDASFDPRPPPPPPPVTGPAQQSPQNMSIAYYTSSGDKWYGHNYTLHGHTPTDSLDGNPATYALSVGNYHPSKDFCTDYFEYDTHGQRVEWVYMHPWAGNYEMYVSVLENGAWVNGGFGNIRYDPTELGLTQSYVNTGANIPYVMKTGTTWESGMWYRLPRTYNAQRIRITFRNHAQSPWGPWYYRCGIREFKIGAGVVSSGREAKKGIDVIPWTFSLAMHPNGAGYWVVDESGRTFAFGDARVESINDRSDGKPNTHDDVANTIVATSTGDGYYVLNANGRVRAYGDATHYGDALTSGQTDFIDMAITSTGNGYWMIRRNGKVYGYGDATVHGDMPQLSITGVDANAYIATGIESHPTLDGYWITNGNGEVRAFGSISAYGGVVARSGMATHAWIRAIRRNPDGDGYYLISGDGNLYTFGSGVKDYGTIDLSWVDPNSGEGYRKIPWDMGVTSTGLGYTVLQADGTISVFGDAQFFGNPGGAGILRYPGNYEDYSDIIKELLLWSGWLLKQDTYDSEEEPPVYGGIESTGIYSDECIDEGVFDKKPVIDAINTIKEIVGYLFWIDEEGGARFESPNWWSTGNFYFDGTRTSFIPEIDEKFVLTDYSVNYSGEQARSEIVISSELPDEAGKTTVTTRYTPPTSNILRGIVRPAMWVNGLFTDSREQRIMAELIAMHIWFSMRTGSLSAVANPCIGINDQIRVMERVTSDTYIHYVRSMSTVHDLETGSYTMKMDTHWLGSDEDWVITSEDIQTGENRIQISENLRSWVEGLDSQFVDVARQNGFREQVAITSVTSDEEIDGTGLGGAADG